MINKNVNEIRSDMKNKVRYATRTYKKSEERGWSRAVPDECWFTGSQLIVQNLFFKDQESQTWQIEANLLTVDMLGEKIQVTIFSDNPAVYQRRVGAAYIGDAEVCSVDLTISFQI